MIASKANLPYCPFMGIVLTITAKGQITLRKELLDHLGLRPGDRVSVDLLEPGRVELHRPAQSDIGSFIGVLPDRGVRASIEEIDAEIAQGWSRR